MRIKNEEETKEARRGRNDERTDKNDKIRHFSRSGPFDERAAGKNRCGGKREAESVRGFRRCRGVDVVHP